MTRRGCRRETVQTAPILLLEDEPATAALIGQLLAAERRSNPIVAFDSGAAALEYLARVAGGEAAVPVLCVLDLSLPGHVRPGGSEAYPPDAGAHAD